MEFSGLLLSSSSITKTMCRTCLAESQTMYKNIQDLVEHDDIKIKLIDILVFLNVVQVPVQYILNYFLLTLFCLHL